MKFKLLYLFVSQKDPSGKVDPAPRIVPLGASSAGAMSSRATPAGGLVKNKTTNYEK